MPPSNTVCMRIARVLFCPCILIFQSLRIMLCGCCCVTARSFALWWRWCCFGRCQGHFRDEAFPPCAETLGSLHAQESNEWARLEDLIGDDRAVLVKGTITPADIMQGTLGDCWLLAAMSAVAEWPALIRKVFVEKKRNAYGKYTFRLFDEAKGEFVEVDVDTYVPVHEGKARFCAPKNGEMWVPLLEKAVAKLIGSYSALECGSTAKGIAILTGARCVRLALQPQGWIRSNRSRVYSPEEVFQVVREFDLHECIMTCSVNEGPASRGISNGHAYTLLSAVEMDGVRLVKIRNPWGTVDWRGAWSDGSPEWAAHPRIAKLLKRKVVEVNSDGEDLVFSRRGRGEVFSSHSSQQGSSRRSSVGSIAGSGSDGAEELNVDDRALMMRSTGGGGGRVVGGASSTRQQQRRDRRSKPSGRSSSRVQLRGIEREPSWDGDERQTREEQQQNNTNGVIHRAGNKNRNPIDSRRAIHEDATFNHNGNLRSDTLTAIIEMEDRFPSSSHDLRRAGAAAAAAAVGRGGGDPLPPKPRFPVYCSQNATAANQQGRHAQAHDASPLSHRSGRPRRDSFQSLPPPHQPTSSQQNHQKPGHGGTAIASGGEEEEGEEMHKRGPTAEYSPPTESHRHPMLVAVERVRMPPPPPPHRYNASARAAYCDAGDAAMRGSKGSAAAREMSSRRAAYGHELTANRNRRKGREPTADDSELEQCSDTVTTQTFDRREDAGRAHQGAVAPTARPHHVIVEGDDGNEEDEDDPTTIIRSLHDSKSSSKGGDAVIAGDLSGYRIGNEALLMLAGTGVGAGGSSGLGVSSSALVGEHVTMATPAAAIPPCQPQPRAKGVSSLHQQQQQERYPHQHALHHQHHNNANGIEDGIRQSAMGGAAPRIVSNPQSLNASATVVSNPQSLNVGARNGVDGGIAVDGRSLGMGAAAGTTSFVSIGGSGYNTSFDEEYFYRPKRANKDGTFYMSSEDFFAIFDYITIGIRTSGGFGDIAYNPHEECRCCGPCCGLMTGCFKFWCCCRGVKALFGAKAPDPRSDGSLPPAPSAGSRRGSVDSN